MLCIFTAADEKSNRCSSLCQMGDVSDYLAQLVRVCELTLTYTVGGGGRTHLSEACSTWPPTLSALHSGTQMYVSKPMERINAESITTQQRVPVPSFSQGAVWGQSDGDPDGPLYSRLPGFQRDPLPPGRFEAAGGEPAWTSASGQLLHTHIDDTHDFSGSEKSLDGPSTCLRTSGYNCISCKWNGQQHVLHRGSHLGEQMTGVIKSRTWNGQRCCSLYNCRYF